MAQFFINRPIVAMVISIIITLAGLVAMSRLPIAQLPEIVPPQIQVSTTYTGLMQERSSRRLLRPSSSRSTVWTTCST